MLVYYAVINLSALRLAPAERHWPMWMSWAGFLLCLALAVLLPLPQVAVTVVVLLVGWTAVTLLRDPGPAG